MKIFTILRIPKYINHCFFTIKLYNNGLIFICTPQIINIMEVYALKNNNTFFNLKLYRNVWFKM